MLQRILSLPFLVILAGIAALAMLVPAAYAYVVRDLHAARVFLYGGMLFLILSAMIGIAAQRPREHVHVRRHLLALLGAYTILPLMLAVPFHEAVRNTTFLNAYFEMVSSLTTTGATLFEEPGRLSNPVHLWRAIVGWMGGFLTWVSAFAILAPMNLGGFEVISRTGPGAGQSAQVTRAADISERLQRYAGRLFPIYAGLTVVLWVALILAGESSFVAVCHAMSTLATSGISPVGGLQNGTGGIAGEVIIFVFLIFAVSRLTFSSSADQPRLRLRLLREDPEFRLALFAITAVPALLFLRHWVGAYDIDEVQNLGAALRALWGSVFTTLSFLTTTGFETSDWADARSWSGLNTPGLILMGLALVGGGVATTAGGVKLLRVYALYKHGRRELARLVHPSSVGGAGAAARQIRRQGATIAWIFFMLFALSVSLVMAALALAGLDFESATVLTVAALSTTGPLVGVAAETPISLADLGGAAKGILCAAMVLGRVETLAIVALLNPEFWRS